MHNSPPYWPSTSSSSPTNFPPDSAPLLDDAAYRSGMAMTPPDLLVHPSELPALVAAKISQPVIDYLVDRVCDAVDFGLGRPSSSSPSFVSKRCRSLTRRWRSDKSDSERAAFAGFVTTVLRRAEVTLCAVIGALVYIDRARPHLSIAIEEWAHHRVLLGALIVASKYLNDASLKNAHWALCTGVFGRRDVQRIEREFLEVLDWELAISEADLVRICSTMVRENALERPVVKPIEPVSVRKEVFMEVEGFTGRGMEGAKLDATHALWDGQTRHHRPEKRSQTDVDMDVDDYAEERARRRPRSAYTSPTSSDSCSTCTASSSPDTDSDDSGSPCTPPPLHQVPHGHYVLPGNTNGPKALPHSMHTKSASNGNMAFSFLDQFPSVPVPTSTGAPVPTPALVLSPVQAPVAPPPLPSLPFPSYAVSRALMNAHPHLHQRPHTTRPSSPYSKLSLSAGSAPGTGSRSRPLTPYSHKRSSALSMYPAYIPAVNV